MVEIPIFLIICLRKAEEGWEGRKRGKERNKGDEGGNEEEQGGTKKKKGKQRRTRGRGETGGERGRMGENGEERETKKETGGERGKKEEERRRKGKKEHSSYTLVYNSRHFNCLIGSYERNPKDLQPLASEYHPKDAIRHHKWSCNITIT